MDKNDHTLHPRVPSMVVVLVHEPIIELLETRHDCGHVLLGRQNGCPQVENPNIQQT